MQELETKRLLLRNWNLSDAGDLFEYARSDLVGPRAGWKPHKDKKESEEIILSFIKSDEVWAIWLKSEQKVVGSIGLHSRNTDKEKELGYVLNPNYWGKGFVPEAARAVISFAFKTLKLDVIWCCCNKNNNNSRRVIEKCNFKYHHQKNIIQETLDNKEVTSLCYSLQREDYQREM